MNKLNKEFNLVCGITFAAVMICTLALVSFGAFADQAYNDCLVKREQSWERIDEASKDWVEIGYTQEMYDRRIELVSIIGEGPKKAIFVGENNRQSLKKIALARDELAFLEQKVVWNIRRVNRLEVECKP